jgi:adenine deaminase
MEASGPALLQRRVRVARGTEPGDLLLAGARVVNVFTGQVEPGNVVVADGWIAGVGPYEWRAARTVDVKGAVVIPGLIDGHMHVESTLLTPAQLAAVIVPHGTAALVADPHEIGNVLGAEGVRMLIRASSGLPLDIYYMAPSCVPALPWEHAGASIGAAEIAALLKEPQVPGLAEMMNFPGVIGADPAVLEKVAVASSRGAAVDGHAPGVGGRDLVAYVAAGIRADHESTGAEEAAAKAALGMMVQVREGSIARNLDTMLPLMADGRLGDWCLCTDDIHPDELMRAGHIDGLLKRVVAGGVPAPQAVRHASLVPARHYGLRDRGAVAPGYRADLVVVDDLTGFRPALVIKDGAVAARDGRYVWERSAPDIPAANTVRLGPLDESAFALDLASDRCNVIAVVPGQIVTRRTLRTVKRERGRWAWDAKSDVALIAVIERHKATGGIGLGLVEGLGFRRPGAIGSSVAHDSHNLIIAGTNAADLLACAAALRTSGGGFVTVSGGAVRALLELPVAGLLSAEPAEAVCRKLEAVRAAARALGCTLSCPFGTLSFLALSVIPELRITDQGLFDVAAQRFITVDS